MDTAVAPSATVIMAPVDTVTTNKLTHDVPS